MAPSLPPTSGINLLTAAHRDAIVASELRGYLPSLGLHEVAPRRWIDGSRPPVRRLFELRLLKGAAITPWWGFSLDFVPHISGGALRWHRSDRTAMLDVIINPAGIVQPSFLYGARRLTDDLRELLAEIVPAIERTWLRGSTDASMLEIIHDLKEHGGNCYHYENYTQLPLAHAFLTAKIGDVGSARRLLQNYMSKRRDSLKEDVPTRLRRHIDDLGQSRPNDS